MDLLKKLLEGTDIEYTEVKFRSDQGFSSARAFVSYSYDEPIVAGKTIVAIGYSCYSAQNEETGTCIFIHF